jgi:hypothetical protein
VVQDGSDAEERTSIAIEVGIGGSPPIILEYLRLGERRLLQSMSNWKYSKQLASESKLGTVARVLTMARNVNAAKIGRHQLTESSQFVSFHTGPGTI